MSDDTQIAKIGNNLPQPGRPQQPIQANLNQYGNDCVCSTLRRHYKSDGAHYARRPASRWNCRWTRCHIQL